MPALQAPDAVVMIRPHAFRSNPETRPDNGFQTSHPPGSANIAPAALKEFNQAVRDLRSAGVTVHDFDDDGRKDTPDSVFPNNWFSTHAGGQVALFPMHAGNRRRERRPDVIERLKRDYRVQTVIDYSGLEQDGLALEGTGAMVLDHIGRIAYAVRSMRADPVLLERFCTHFNYEPLVFQARDADGRDVYHTNVLMSIGTAFSLICLDMIVDPSRCETIVERLSEGGREIIDLSPEQIGNFAGNAMELSGKDGRILVLSSRAVASLSAAQKEIIERSARLLPLDIPTIETAGGSVRCMLAGIHLTRR